MIRSALELPLIAISVVAAPTLASAAGTQQLDWSGGPGVPGPVTYWEESFDDCLDMSWAGAGGLLVLDFSFILHWIHSTGPGGDEMEIVDTDGDGDLDVVSCQMAFDRISHWENLDGSGLSWARTIIADSLDYPKSLDAIDIDADGDTDLVVNTNNGPFWIENTGSMWVAHQISALDCDNVRAGDVDGDGDPDVVALKENPVHQLRWYENLDGTGGSWQDHLISSEYDALERARISDIDNDGDLDVVASQGWGPQLVWFENLDGSGETWADHVICDYIGEYYIHVYGLEAVDMDGDSDLDLAVVGSGGLPYGLVIWVENVNGLGTSWLKHPVDNDLSGASSVSAGDMDGDGDVDLLACSGYSWGEDLVAWYENTDGEATAWNRHELDDTVIDAKDVAIEDMDMDGDQDAVLCDQLAGVRWYVFSRAASGWLESSILDPPGGSQLQWTDLSWESTVPAGTILTFQVRASDNPADMGAWSPAFAEPGSVAPYLPDPAWYFQYRVNMVTGVPPVSPVLDEVLVQYNSVGIGGEPDNDEPTLTVLSGNPSPGIVILDVYMPEAGLAGLLIYDIAGRLVEEPLSGQTEAGHHQLTIIDLPAGCYQAVMETENSITDIRLVVLR